MEAWDTYLTGLNYFRKSNLRADYISAKTYFDAAYQIDTLFVEAIDLSNRSIVSLKVVNGQRNLCVKKIKIL